MGNIFRLLLVQPLTNGLILFYNIFGANLGLAILGFSLFLIYVMRPLTKPYMESMKRKLYIRSNDPDAADIIQNNCNIELFDTNIDWVSQYYCGKSPFIILFLQIVENNKNKTLFKKTKVANQI